MGVKESAAGRVQLAAARGRWRRQRTAAAAAARNKHGWVIGAPGARLSHVRTCCELQQARLVLCRATGGGRQQRGQQRQPAGCTPRPCHFLYCSRVVNAAGEATEALWPHGRISPHASAPATILDVRALDSYNWATETGARGPCALLSPWPPPPSGCDGLASMHAGLGASPILPNGAQPHGPGAALRTPTSSGMRRRALSSLRQILATAAPQRPRSVAGCQQRGAAAAAAANAAKAAVPARHRAACLLASWHCGAATHGACTCAAGMLVWHQQPVVDRHACPLFLRSPCRSFSGFPREVGSTAVPQAPKQPASSSSGSTSRVAQRARRSRRIKEHDLVQRQMGEGGRPQRPAAAPASQTPLHVNGMLPHRDFRPSSALAQQSVQQGPATTQQQVYSSPPSSNGATAGWGAAPGAAARSVPAAEPWLPSPPPSQQPSSSSNGRPAAAPSTPRRGRPPATPAEPVSSQDRDEAGAEGKPSDEQIEEMFMNAPPPDVHVVDSLAAAQATAAQLMALGGPDSQVVFACDTEVMDIDVTCVRGCCRFAFACLFYAAAGSVGCCSAAAAVHTCWRGLLLLKPLPGLPAAAEATARAACCC